MTDVERIAPIDAVPEADVADQRHAVDSEDETGLDTSYVADIATREANPADLIDQAIVVPVPHED
ncbi:hypothetical protein [Mycobacterium sp.]|uniref:hypothetical protein n=1 Tax=Mycobacterium sp. TaxID=1785 RepID=UPI001271D9F9|nr:hypothetical protein [Mycobacterium sp.]KAA8963421.1 MAG: hypothetical protein F6Q13_11105 [Mycobacterium sp.]